MPSDIVNPFKPTAGAEPPHLIGRSEVLVEFRAGIEGGVGAPGRLMRISGPRGSGKTVLLTELGDVARSYGWRVVDVSAGADLIADLLLELTPQVTVEGASVSASALVGKGELDLAVRQPNLRALMGEASCGSKGLLLTIDEVQDASHEDMQRIATAVQHLVRERAHVALVFAGLPMGVMDLINGKAMTFLRRAVSEELGAISCLEVGLSLQESFGQSGLLLEGEALERAAELTGGYPYLIQLVGFYVWERANAHRVDDATVRMGDIDTGAAIAMERFHQTVHEPAIANVTRNALEYLFAMAESEVASSTAELAVRLGKSASAASSCRRLLLQQQVIEQTAPGYVGFAVPYLREYLLDNKAEILARYGVA